MPHTLATKALRVEDLYPDEEDARLQLILQSAYRRALRDLHAIVGEAFDLDPLDFRLPDATAQAWAAEHAAERVTQISTTTRTALRELIADSIADGRSTADVIQGVEDLYLNTWKGRAETISRTEIATAQRDASVSRYTESGIVDRVKIRDGEDDSPCRERNGTTVALGDAPTLAHPNCLIGGQVVFAPNVDAASTRWFDGEVIVLRTAAHDLLTCTPNHPVLTDRGWVAAQFINEGDHVLRCVDGERLALVIDPDHDHRPTLIEQVADSFGPAGGMVSTAVPGTAEDFHGDGADSDVNIVWPDGFRRDSGGGQHGEQFAFSSAPVGLGAFHGDGMGASLIERADATTRRVVGGGGDGVAVGSGHSAIAQAHRRAHGAGVQATLSPSNHDIGGTDTSLFGECGQGLTRDVAGVQSAIQGIVATLLGDSARHDGPTEAMESQSQRVIVDANIAGDFQQRFPGLVALARVSEVFRRPFRGHVYNLQTKEGWYVAENIVTHNCTLILIPVLREGIV